MSVYECGICGNIHDDSLHGEFAALSECPVCGAPSGSFKPRETREASPVPQNPVQGVEAGAIYECPVCGNIHDERRLGAFDALPGDWCCPVCGTVKGTFTRMERSTAPMPAQGAPPPQQPSMPPEPPQQSGMPPEPPQQPVMSPEPPQQPVMSPEPPQQSTMPPGPPQQSTMPPGPPQQSTMPSGPPQQSTMPPEPPQQPAVAGKKAIYECPVCGNIHDEHRLGSFDTLPSDWECPVCGNPKHSFVKQEKKVKKPIIKKPGIFGKKHKQQEPLPHPLDPMPEPEAQPAAQVQPTPPPIVPLDPMPEPEAQPVAPPTPPPIAPLDPMPEQMPQPQSVISQNWVPKPVPPRDESHAPVQPVHAGEWPAIWECPVCGNEYNEDKQGLFSVLSEEWECPVCGSPKKSFMRVQSALARENILDQTPPVQPEDIAEAVQPVAEPQPVPEPQPIPAAQPVAEPQPVPEPQPIPELQAMPEQGEPNVRVCGVCGFEYNESMKGTRFDALAFDWECPVCGSPKVAFHVAGEEEPEPEPVEELEPEQEVPEEQEEPQAEMQELNIEAAQNEPDISTTFVPMSASEVSSIYQCGICGYEYDEEMEDKLFTELPQDWECPMCGSPKVAYACLSVEEIDAEGVADLHTERPLEQPAPTLELQPEQAEQQKPPEQQKQQPEPQKVETPPEQQRVEKFIPKMYECGICGHAFDERNEVFAWEALKENWECPMCGSPKSAFKCNGPAEQIEMITGESVLSQEQKTAYEVEAKEDSYAYPKKYFRQTDGQEKYMNMIHEMAVTRKSVVEPMRTHLPTASWEDIHFLGAQLSPFPLDIDAPVNIKTVIGKNADKPMELDMPVFVTHMSFGALSRELKAALAEGSARANTAIGSGEGGVLPEEMGAAHKFILEYVPRKYGANTDNLKNADAIEIKIGQGTKPGMGGYLPAEKVTSEIAAVRRVTVGESVVAPSRFPNISSRDDLKKLVDKLREDSEGRPIGIKLAAGHIEQDLEAALAAGVDFVTIDGRGGSTGASPKFIKDASSVPTIYALHRARKFLDERHSSVELIITGGFRTSGDVVKALCMGADAVAMGTAMLMAASCMQYRVCNTGKCPTGSLTQSLEMRKALKKDAAAARAENYLHVLKQEISAFCRASGHEQVGYLGLWDICTANRDIAEYTNVPHV